MVLATIMLRLIGGVAAGHEKVWRGDEPSGKLPVSLYWPDVGRIRDVDFLISSEV